MGNGRAKIPAELKPPKGMSPAGRGYWLRIVRSFSEVHDASRVDLHLIELTVATWEEWQDARADVVKNGGTIKTTSERGYEITKMNPSATLMGQASVRLLNCLKQLGLTPATRRTSGSGDDDELDDLING